MQSQASERLIHSTRQPLPMVVASRYFHRPISTRLVVGWVLVVIAALLLTASRAGSQPTQGGESAVGSPMIAEKQFVGVANRNGVIVRAGAGLGELTVTTLAKGQEVVVVGGTGEYLRILPPEGTFCLVARARVNIRGNADATKRSGRIIENTSVRVGSTVNSSIDKSPARLAAGEEVVVIGENNIYYHVEPPKGVFFYVEKRDLAKAREVKVREAAAGWRVSEIEPEPVAVDDAPQDSVADATDAETPEVVGNATADAGTGDPAQPLATPEDAEDAADAVDEPGSVDEPAVGGEDAAPVALPTTQPILLTEFEELDARYVSSTELPIEEQPLEELKSGYETLLEKARADAAAEAIVPIIEARLTTIAVRQEAVQDLAAMQAMRKQLEERQKALEVEQQELAERAATKNVTIYRAVGQIQPSSLQIGDGSLFRLCDPATGRTMIYLRVSGDALGQVARLLEEFAGVQGEVVERKEMSLKYIEVTSADAVDKSQVLHTVAAEIIPPSLVRDDAGTR